MSLVPHTHFGGLWFVEMFLFFGSSRFVEWRFFLHKSVHPTVWESSYHFFGGVFLGKFGGRGKSSRVFARLTLYFALLIGCVSYILYRTQCDTTSRYTSVSCEWRTWKVRFGRWMRWSFTSVALRGAAQGTCSGGQFSRSPLYFYTKSQSFDLIFNRFFFFFSKSLSVFRLQ